MGGLCNSLGVQVYHTKTNYQIMTNYISTKTSMIIDKYDDKIATLLAAVRRIERFLGPDDDWIEDDRRIVYEAADSLLRPIGRPTIREKGTADYVTTAHATPDAIERVFHNAGFQRNLLSTRKYREDHGGGRQWAVGSWVLDPLDTNWQYHIFLFPSPNGGCDIYGHREASVTEPAAHSGGDELRHGDPNGRVRGLLSEVGVPFGNRQL